MSERIREPSLAMTSPRRFVVRGRFYRSRARLGSAIDETAGLIDEDLDPRGRQSDLGRARLCLAARHSLVNEERGAVEMKPGDSAQVPELGGAKGGLVPADRRSSVGNDQHHRKTRPAAVVSHNLTTRYRRSRNPHEQQLRRRGRVGGAISRMPMRKRFAIFAGLMIALLAAAYAWVTRRA